MAFYFNSNFLKNIISRSRAIYLTHAELKNKMSIKIFPRIMSLIRDPNTCANFNEITIENIEIDWFVDFERTRIVGIVILHYKVLNNTNKIIFDISDQIISTIKLNGKKCNSLNGEIPLVGKYLQINSDFRLGEKGQCQQIHAKSIIPCMDTPAVKQKYIAKITVPKGMQCLMSAVLLEDKIKLNKNGKYIEYNFIQKVPIPSYLFAIVVGALVKKDISKRCAVWAEPSMVNIAHKEFEETEKMLEIATELMGEYRWGRFDMIVLPPFFSFGGMENPCMTFVTPTIIAGDRSLTTVVAHEIAHSFTEYVEYKILGKMFGEQFRLFMHLLGWEDHLRMCIYETFHPEHPFTRLIVPLDGQCADDVFSPIPYQKGAALLLLLEQRLGDPLRFEQFLRNYINKYAYKSIVTDEWIDYLYEFYDDKRAILDSINWNNWLHRPGMPPQKPTFDETLLKTCKTLANTWLYGSDKEVSSLNSSDFDDMMTAQKEKFFSLLDVGISNGNNHLFNHNRIEFMEQKYLLNNTGNCDVKCQWILVALQARWEPIIPIALKFVSDIGRVKYVRPCYQRMFEWKISRELALETFEKNKPKMHNFTIQFVQSLLNNKNKKGATTIEEKKSEVENGIEVCEDIYLNNCNKGNDTKEDFIKENKCNKLNGIKTTKNDISSIYNNINI
ncbi:Leuk-A4-hydro_C domain-containing protein [Meloidogyne graminicola]|uniref:Leuk-A4-hydro_C domain-containing protein n=1 Tax=Meloidogyne graminicola TaxID=189291 RepID=A0A8S9ZI39_9BILA|nr:Leuk-A4-hydro_C domain-containing protein [Meloidogyne graminicola]